MKRVIRDVFPTARNKHKKPNMSDLQRARDYHRLQTSPTDTQATLNQSEQRRRDTNAFFYRTGELQRASLDANSSRLRDLFFTINGEEEKIRVCCVS